MLTGASLKNRTVRTYYIQNIHVSVFFIPVEIRIKYLKICTEKYLIVDEMIHTDRYFYFIFKTVTRNMKDMLKIQTFNADICDIFPGTKQLNKKSLQRNIIQLKIIF